MEDGCPHKLMTGIAALILALIAVAMSVGPPTNTAERNRPVTEPQQDFASPPLSPDNPRNEFCLSSSERGTIKQLCHRNNSDDGRLCVIAVEEPTYFEHHRGKVNESSLSTVEIFPCNEHVSHGFDGVVFEILKEHRTAWDTMTCIYGHGCSFNQIAELAGDKSEQNPKGVGDETSLIYAGFLLWSAYRQDLGLSFSKTYYREKVVLIGVDPGDSYHQSALQPIELVKRTVEPVVVWILGVLFSAYTFVTFFLGGSDVARRWHYQGTWLAMAFERYNTTYFSPAQAEAALNNREPARPAALEAARRRVQCLRTYYFLLLLCLGGALVLFEGALLLSTNPPPLQTGRPLEQLVRDGKIYLINNTALLDSMLISFAPDLATNLKLCENTRDCLRQVASNKGSYHLTLESLAFSRALNFENVAVYQTDISLNMFEGGFFFSSGLPKKEKDQMEAVLYNVTLKDHGQWLEEKIRAH